jgi:glycerophosphoryl diester phosphodiesterase
MKIISHRGARGLAPENTVAAVAEALKYRAKQVEVDVRVTKDGVPVLSHAARAASGTSISDLTFKELRGQQPELATLEEAIKAADQKLPLYIEVKPRVSTSEIIQLLRRYLKDGWQPQNFWVASFSQKTLRELHNALPELPTIVIEHFSGVRAAWRARELGTKYIVINQHVAWSGFIKSMSRRGWKLGVYTLNDPAKAKRWEKYGLYAVVTDYPDRFQSQVK